MDGIKAKRDRLLVRTAQLVVGGALLVALLFFSTPATAATVGYWAVAALLIAAGACTAVFQSRAWPYVFPAFLVFSAAVALVAWQQFSPMPLTASYAVGTVLGIAAPGASVVLLTARLGHLWYWLIGAAAAAIAVVMLEAAVGWFWPGVLVAIGWVIGYACAVVIIRSVPEALQQVKEIGKAHRAERQASEMEANRRQSARLLHDTVLATLTLLAHSGVGVSTEALRSQARNDAHLLRQLRLGEPLFSLAGAGYAPESVEETTLGTTLESVRLRFDGLGLDVAWHGATRIALPQHVLDAFLFSISESLENVRRHSGVRSAHVTVSESDAKVTAMITDAGKGFTPELVSDQRLGIKESVIGRLAEVGGTARVFSAPGAGTTVLLEVPR